MAVSTSRSPLVHCAFALVAACASEATVIAPAYDGSIDAPVRDAPPDAPPDAAADAPRDSADGRVSCADGPCGPAILLPR